MVDTLDFDGCIVLTTVQIQMLHTVDGIGEGRLVVIGQHTRVAYIEIRKDEFAFVYMR